MEITTFGARGVTCQINSIDLGLKALGHTLSQSGVSELVYSNDPAHHDEAINYQKENGGKLILTVLDIPEHLLNIGQFDLENLKKQLDYANAITTISKTVQAQIKDFLGLDSKVIYNPAKDVYEIPGMYQKCEFLKFLHVGRRDDPNKRYYDIIVPLMEKYYNPNQLVNVGGDRGIGKVTGIVSDDFVNVYYNHSDYVLVSTLNGGIELPVIEGLVAKIQEIESNPEKYNEIIKNYQQKYTNQFHKVSVARNIVDVFENL